MQCALIVKASHGNAPQWSVSRLFLGICRFNVTEEKRIDNRQYFRKFDEFMGP